MRLSQSTSWLPLLALLLLAGCGAGGPRRLPEATLTAPEGTGFVVKDANGLDRLAHYIQLGATPEGLLTTVGGHCLMGPATIPSDARFIRLASDGVIAVRNSNADTYSMIGQLQLGRLPAASSSGNTANAPLAIANQLGLPGRAGFGQLTPVMYAIVRQGAQIHLVLVEYGSGD